MSAGCLYRRVDRQDGEYKLINSRQARAMEISDVTVVGIAKTMMQSAVRKVGGQQQFSDNKHPY
jgi:hypothetical protein